MNELSKYRTIFKQSEGLYKAKGSKFIGYAVACYSEDEAKVLLEKWKKENHQAGHLCYAYRFELDGKKYRSNDDGEPANSAGPPILGQIDSFELCNVLIGVVRYYGGTNLGVGGLITAYRTAAKDAIQNGQIVELEVHQWYEMVFDYHDMPHIMNLLKKNNIELSNKKFETNCELTIRLPLNLSKMLSTELQAYYSVKLNDLGVY